MASGGCNANGSGAAPGSTSSNGTAAATGASSASAAGNACGDAATALVTAVARAVASYDAPSAAAAPRPGASTTASPTAPTAATSSPQSSAQPTDSASDDPSGDLNRAAAAARAAISRYACPTSTFRGDLETGLKAVRTQTPVAAAILARLTASLTGQGPATPRTATVSPGDDLAATVGGLAPGSTVLLQAGTYTLSRSLVLLDGVTLRGSGRDTTLLKSTAPDAAVVVMTAGRVELSDLRLDLDPGVPASGLVAATQSTVVLSSLSVSGATATPAGLGGAGVQMSGRASDRPSTVTTLQVTDSEFDHNGWAGIALGGGHRASILRAGFTANGQCGVCFLDASSGSVQDSTFKDDLVALGANGTARPTWVDNTVTGGTVGVQLDGSAAPTIKGLTVTGAQRAALIASGRSGGAFTSVSCASVPYGIVIADTAAPTVGETTCTLAKGG